MKPFKDTYGTIPNEDAVETNNKEEDEDLARLDVYGKACGLLYLTIMLCGMTAEAGVRGTLIDFTSISNTVLNLSTYPMLFRFGLMADLIMCCANVCVAVLLGGLLVHAGANPVLAILSSIFRFLRTGTIAVNLLHMFVASLLLDPNFALAGVVSSSSLEEEAHGEGMSHGSDIAFLFLIVHKYGYLMALIFTGISMLFLGGIILKWGIFPHMLGIMIILGGLGYIVDSCFYFMSAAYFGEYTSYFMIPVFLADFGFTAWLLFSSPTKARKTD